MDFRIEQRFSVPASAVLSALCDPGYLEAMSDLRDISAPHVRSHEREGSRVRQVLEFQFRGRLPSAVTRVVDPARLSWLEHDAIDLDLGECRFSMVPVHYERFFSCSGVWVVTAEGEGCRRTITGALKVSAPVPFVGGKVEKAIVSGLRERLADEPAMLERWHRSQTG